MPTPQEIQAWLAANPAATDRDIAAAMNQYGVSAADLSGAMGWDQGAITDRYGVANAQNYIDTQLSGDGSLPWWGSAYKDDGTFDYSNNQRNNLALGAMAGMGLTADQQARALGLPSDAIQAYAQQNAPSVDIYSSIYQKDLTSPAPYMQPMQPTSNAASTLGITQAPQPARPSTTPSLPPGLNGVPFSPTGGYQTGGNTGGGGFSMNPWQTQMADEIGRRTQQGLGEAFNQIRSNAVGNGTLGGSRQGVAQGVATGRAMDSMQGQLGGLFGGLYESGQNRDLSRYNIEGNQNLANQSQWMNFYTGQRGQDLQSIGLGADLYSKGIGGEWAPIQGASGAYAPFSGYGSTTNSSQQGGGWQGGIGGALAGGSFGRQMGWW